MSSHALSVSGQRPLSSTVNDPARTAASMSSKPGDMAHVYLSAFREFHILLPSEGVEVERFKNEDGTIIQVLKVRGRLSPDGERIQGIALQLDARPVDEGHGYPHTSVNVRKDDGKDPFESLVGSYESDDTICLDIPPTEPES